MAARQRGKHRSARRPVTPLTVLADSVSVHAGALGRSTAVVAVGGGLLASGGAMAANAADAGSTQAVGTAVISDSVSPLSAKALIDAKSIATTPADAEWSSEVAATPTVKVTKPKPKPKPVVQRVQQTASRSGTYVRSSATQAQLKASSKFQTNGNAVLEIAKRYVGVPYVWAGASPSGFDCSGFTMYVFGQLGYKLPHASSGQLSSGRHVSAADAKPGDLFITPGHVVIYAGGGMMIDAARPGTTIQFRPMYTTNGTFVRVAG